uniref:LRAT domain-containing protein n=1 Tax=Pygocentrus nattereri TaxID=42514 RepID=A0A3B4CY48_PYGNA
MMGLKLLLIFAVFLLPVSSLVINFTLIHQLNPVTLCYGDIVRYPRKCNFYSHYAIYVGEEPFPGKKPGQNTFEMTSIKLKSNCYFGKLEKDHEVFNYRDKDTKVKTWAEMSAKIQQLHQNCGSWKVTNTCEHIATKIRYGDDNASCKQVCNSSSNTFLNFLKNIDINYKKTPSWRDFAQRLNSDADGLLSSSLLLLHDTCSSESFAFFSTVKDTLINLTACNTSPFSYSGT